MLLIIDTNKKRRDTVSEIFHFMGILSFGTDPTHAFSEISEEYRAILISEPMALPDPEDYIEKLSVCSGRIPIFALSEASVPDRVSARIARLFSSDIYSSVLITSIIDYLEEHDLPSVGKYLLAGLDAGCDLGEVRYMSQKMDFTKTETMIIRYLTVAYPTPKSAEAILAHTSKPGKLTEPSVIRTHISSINKKFKRIRGRSLIIQAEGGGYRIATPEMPETK